MKARTKILSSRCSPSGAHLPDLMARPPGQSIVSHVPTWSGSQFCLTAGSAASMTSICGLRFPAMQFIRGYRVRGMKYLLFVGLAFAGAFGLPDKAAAVDVIVGQTKIELVGPKNFCLLDKKHSLDSQVLDLTQQTIQGRNELLAMFADCTRLAAWHDGKADDLGDTFDFQVSLRAKNLNATK